MNIEEAWKRFADRSFMVYTPWDQTLLTLGDAEEAARALAEAVLEEAVRESWKACCQRGDDHSMSALRGRINALP